MKSNTKQESTDCEMSQENDSASIQTYLISRYRNALKKGDKSGAKAYLMSAKFFSVNDTNVTNEIYIMAKSDGDIVEASKCFSTIFNDIVSAHGITLEKTSEPSSVIYQLKEEVKAIMSDLKTRFLKLRSIPAPGALASRAPSVSASPMLSPTRASPEERATSRESVTKLDNHLKHSTKSLYYQHLFEHLPEDCKKVILDFSIQNCESPFERCRLMMLAMCIFHETASTYGSRLLKTLIDLSDPSKFKSDEDGNTPHGPRSSMMCRYANNLLVLDAIPLTLSLCQLSSLEVAIDELFDKTLNLYSDSCLEASASEHDASELHDGVKKAIAARILGVEPTVISEEASEEYLISTLDLLREKFTETILDESTKSKLEEIRSIVCGGAGSNRKLNDLLDLIGQMKFEDIADELLDRSAKNDLSTTTPITTTPPKGRGRPKKASQPVASNNVQELDKSKSLGKLREIQFVFYSLVEYMFVNCTSYLKNTRSRILLEFSNPLAAQIKAEISKGPSPRTSRSKGASQQNSEPANKKVKLTSSSDRSEHNHSFENSPLYSEQSRAMDMNILTTLDDAIKCRDFICSSAGIFNKLWQRFSKSNQIENLSWYKRFSIDSMILHGHYDQVIDLLDSLNDTSIDSGKDTSEPSDLRSPNILSTNPSLSNVKNLRTKVQLISCYTQRLEKVNSFSFIGDLISSMKCCGLFENDDGYSSGDTIDEYKVTVPYNKDLNLGFLFFDTVSILRYSFDMLMDVLKVYATVPGSISDTSVGHAITLSQFDWPKESSTYIKCIDWIRANKPKSTTPQCLSAATKFTYPDFFQYIFNPSIIEDFMAMLLQGYTLDIRGSQITPTAPNSQGRNSGSSQTSSTSSRSNLAGTPSRSGKAITTRGVNKSFKEDLKVALVSQMKSSNPMVPLDTIAEFIQVCLVPFMTSYKKP